MLKKLKEALKTNGFRQGIYFGIIASTLTSLGLVISNYSTNAGFMIMVATIIGISISNALADSFSIYMADDANKDDSNGLISAAVVFVCELIIPYIFLIPFLFFDNTIALQISILLGSLTVLLSGYNLSKYNGRKKNEIIKDLFIYLVITITIIFFTFYGAKLAMFLTGQSIPL